MFNLHKSRIAAWLGVWALVAVLVWWLTKAQREEAVTPPPAAPATGATGASTTGEAKHTLATNDQGLVEIDMLGTKLDAARLFDLGFAGGLTIDENTRSTLDTLLIAMPDEMSAQDIEKLEWTLRNGLPQADADKAIKMFHGYRAYLGDSKGELQRMGIPSTPAAADAYFDQLAQLQRRHFDDATATALFGQENQSARLVLQAALVSQNEALGLAEKKAQIEQLRAQLPQDRRHLIPDAEPPPAEPAKP